MKKYQDSTSAAEIAQFRLALISPIICNLYPDVSQNAYCRRVTAEPLTLPDGTVATYSPKTISKWVSQYKNGGFDALMPRERSDKGTSRALPERAVCEVYRLMEKYPKLNATQIYNYLVREGFIPATVNVCSVQRFVKENDLKSARNPTLRDRKAFEEPFFGNMWQADTVYLPQITEDGKTRRVYCIMIIDDHSRLVVGGGLFYEDNSGNFQKVLKEAVATYGIPVKLYVDHGSTYDNGQLALICGAIGTVLLHPRIRDGASKGKVERSWATLKQTWLYTLDLEEIHSLKQFNEMLRDYIRSYNTSYHSGIKCTPMERYLEGQSHTRTPESQEWLDECFLNRIHRKVRKDATITIDKVLYDVPMQFISSQVEIRFLPNDMSSAFIYYDGERFPIRATNKNENCRTRRNNPPALDYSRIGGSTD